MTFEELQVEVFRRLDESSSDPAFWTEDDVKAALNEAYHEISDTSEWYERNANLPLLSHRTYYDLRTAVGSDTVLSIRHGQNSNTRRWLTPADLRELDYHTFNQWEEITGEPQSFFIRGLFWLGTFPKQASDDGHIRLYFTSLPAEMTYDYDEPGFPEEFHYGLVEYALGDLLSQEAETKKALTHYREYVVYETGLTGWVSGRQSLDRISRLNG